MKKLILALNLATCVLSPAFASDSEDDNCYSSTRKIYKSSTIDEDTTDDNTQASQQKPYDPACIDGESSAEFSATLSLGLRVLRFFGVL